LLAEARPQAIKHRRSNNWDRARLSVVVPIGVIVAVAIICIVVAVLSSANRADDVAVQYEKQLFTRALANHSERVLRELESVTSTDNAVRHISQSYDADWVRRRVGGWLNSFFDHDVIMVFDRNDRMIYSFDGMQPGENGRNTALSIPNEIKPTLDYLRGRRPAISSNLQSDPDRAAHSDAHMRAATVGSFLGRPALIAAATVGPRDQPALLLDSNAPAVVSVKIIDREVLDEIASRLRLQNLREVGGNGPGGHDYVFVLTESGGAVAGRFAWTPRQPGALIVNSVLPYIGVALGGFALLAAFVLRYMRRTAAAIAAGETRLRHLAMHDPLCGLPNRIFFSERLEAVITQVRGGSTPAAVVYIDLDHFKDVNDTLGHPIGDELIRNVTLRLSHTMRDDDLVARLGGDEFAVITFASAEPTALQEIAVRAIGALCAPYSVNGHTIVIGASIGIAIIDKRTGSAADIMRYADMALYRAKNEGRNRACVYDEVMDADLSQRKLVEQELREAIDNDRLKVLYQPIFNASGERVVGVEALARWPHPTRGLVSPAEFIPIAEHSGLIIELGARVLRRACLDGKAWPGITVSVNVSPLQFRRLDFVSMVERTLAETGLDPTRLELELTESTLLGNLDSAESAMHRLRAMGVRLALDDFGTGYSSLLYLRRFPFDKLKIDRSFVLSIEKATDAAAIVHAIVSLGRGLGMTVTAEGVETAEQHLFLRAAGVHCMQGFRFGAPSEPAEISERLANPGIYRTIEGDARAALAS
jgi:diguanylate cyclase (GGDEF)-like protein